MEKIQLIINGIASINAFLLFGILCFRKNNTLPNYMLSGMMAIPFLYFANSILMLEQAPFPWLFFVVQFCAIFYFPFFSTYVYAILGKPITHLLPVYLIALIIGIMPLYLCYLFFNDFSTMQQEEFFLQLIKGPYPEGIVFYSLVFYSTLQIGFIWLFIEVNKIRKKAIQFYADIDRYKINYLLYLIALMVILNFLIVLLYSVFDILFVEYILLPIIISIIYGYIIYFAFKNYGIFTKKDYQIHLNQIKEFNTEIEVPFQNDKTPLFMAEVEKLLLEDNLAADPELTLKKLAQSLNRPMYEVSRLINKELNSNFYSLINEMRIVQAKKLMKQKTNYTIEGIGYEVGFNSRASFYRAFKKQTGITPRKFIEINAIETTF